nr:immunoglobulin light chain junction region [Macaca mulatta]
CQHYYDNILTF